MDASLFTKKGGAYMDVLAAFLRKNDLIPYSEASNLADYFLTDRPKLSERNGNDFFKLLLVLLA